MVRCFFTLEGNIGSGKSTLLRAIQHAALDELCVLQEPVQEWERPSLSDGRSMLQAFYDDPSRHAASFQMYVLLTRLNQIMTAAANAPAGVSILSERCIETGMQVFGHEQRASGRIDDVAWHAYCGWNDVAVTACRRTLGAPPAGVVYLRCSPETNVRRVEKRGRTAETAGACAGACGVTPEYIAHLHARHEDWVAGMRATGVPVLVLDGDRDGDDAIRQHASDVVDWIRSIVAAKI